MKDGWLVLDKPPALSSATCGNILKKTLNLRKIGHTGTLDPLATGVLVFACGEATKLIPFLPEHRKTYRFEVQWGEERTTDDTEGDIVETSLHRPSEDDIRNILPLFIGTISQKPPQFSAVHVHGKRAYALARAGISMDLSPRLIHIEALEFIKSLSDSSEFYVRCGKGVYVRSLARDLAKALGTLGHIKTLRRVEDGCFSEKDTISLEKIQKLEHNAVEEGLLFPMEKALPDVGHVSLSLDETSKMLKGCSVRSLGPSGLFWVHRTPKNPIVIAQRKGGILRPLRSFCSKF